MHEADPTDCLTCSLTVVPVHVSAAKAQRLLGWTPQHDFLSDVPALVELYKKEGRMNKQPDFTIDDKILAATKSAVLA